jgi:hypothetical protein
MQSNPDGRWESDEVDVCVGKPIMFVNTTCNR